MEEQDDLAASASMSATTSLITVRTIRFFNRASIVGAFQTVGKSSARVAKDAADKSDRGAVALS